MVGTWQGDWSEDGLRVLYVLPDAETDALLPITIEPEPDALVRTMVGRLEIITPERVAAMWDAIHSLPPDALERPLMRSRFAEPTLVHMLANSSDPQQQARLGALISLFDD